MKIRGRLSSAKWKDLYGDKYIEIYRSGMYGINFVQGLVGRATFLCRIYERSIFRPFLAKKR
jgi:hypothetical protein